MSATPVFIFLGLELPVCACVQSVTEACSRVCQLLRLVSMRTLGACDGLPVFGGNVIAEVAVPTCTLFGLDMSGKAPEFIGTACLCHYNAQARIVQYTHVAADHPDG